MQISCIDVFTATLCRCRNKHPYFLYSLTLHKPPDCSRMPAFSTISPALSRKVLFFPAVNTSHPHQICPITGYGFIHEFLFCLRNSYSFFKTQF